MITYHLEDDTMQVNENIVENSGMPQGPFIKRQTIYKENGKRFSTDDFRVGETINIYAKKFKIVDCDEFTRVSLIFFEIVKNYYQKKGITQSPAIPIPEADIQTGKNKEFAVNMDAIAELKEYQEVRLGGGHPNRNLKTFLDNNRKVYCKPR